MTIHLGLIGLGTMGAALALNFAEKGYPVAVWNRTRTRTTDFVDKAGALKSMLMPAGTLEDLVGAIARPRTIILMVPAGEAVDAMMGGLAPLLDEGDIIIDGGNANFHDTNRRAEAAAGLPHDFIGLGVSGGEDGARHGPSMMAGCTPEAYERVREPLEAIAARYKDGTPCVGLMGPGGAGHFVKMVHNGIEYADMQMIAEAYGLMRDGAGASAGAIGAAFARFNEGPLRSYLIEISAKVAAASDPQTGKPVLDVIVDAAGQKGTGRWTVIEAQEVAVAVPVIEAAVTARNLSSRRGERQAVETVFGAPVRTVPAGMLSERDIESALIAGKIACYAQGFAMLGASDSQYGWTMPLPLIARVWREGCIIRSAMLDDMASALEKDGAQNLILAPYFSGLLQQHVPGLRRIVALAATHGLAVPALAAALSWFDTIRTARGTANLIQAQRDFFGAHGFRRIDRDGDFHGPW